MARANYQYGTSPRKTVQEIPKKATTEKKPKLRVVEDLPRQKVSISKAQRKKQVQTTMLAIFVFVVLLAIGYRNSQINVKFNEMQNQKKQLATLQKENEQLEINIQNGLNLSTIEKEAEEKLGMQKLTNKQTIYITLPKKDYVEATTEKVILEEEKSWFDTVKDWVLHLFKN